MLIDGRIDLLSDVSYTEERAEKMLYSSLPMGAEEYYIFVSPRNKEITPEDFSTFNGKKVGGNKGSVQLEFFRQWAEANGVRAEILVDGNNLGTWDCGQRLITEENGEVMAIIPMEKGMP